MKNVFLKFLFIVIAFLTLCVPAFSDGESQNADNEQPKYKYVDYSKYDVNDLTSFRALTKQFQRDFKDKKGTQEAEDAYLEIMDYYNDFVDAQNKVIFMDAVIPYATEEFEKNKNILYVFGIVLWWDDGGGYLRTSNQYVYKNFAPYLSKEWQELLKFQLFFDERITLDARFVIPKSKIREIIQYYKNFSKKYPEFAKRRKIDELIKINEDDLKHYPYL